MARSHLPNGKQLVQRSNATEESRTPIIKSMNKMRVAKMTAKTMNDSVPLMAAARVGNIEIVTLMLEHGCNPWHKDTEGNTALDMAIANGHEACIDILLQNMRITIPQDYAPQPATTVVDDVEESRSNVVSIFKNSAP